MKATVRVLGASVLLALIFLGIAHHEAKADFMAFTGNDPDGVKFYIDKVNGKDAKDVSSFTGHVGGQDTGPIVEVFPNVNVDTGSGYANIKPSKDLALKSLAFTPADPLLFGDFSFRGQLDAKGIVTVSVWDSAVSLPQIFSFNIAKANQDFDRIGIISTDDETIYKVEISSDGFKEVKQVDFSYADPSPVPEPITLLLVGLGLVGLGILGRRMKSAN